MDKNSTTFMSVVIDKVRSIDPENRLEDGSVEVAVSDTDIKDILNKKVLRSTLKPRLEEDLESAGMLVNKTCSGALEITIPKDMIDTKAVKYSDL